QVIALVMDSFTDIDIFGDLQDAYKNRKVPVYILLDQDFLPHFLEMCKNLGVCPEQESLMRVRTLTGNTYYMRSGAKIVGKVHEKFMLIDGIRVTTGSYRQINCESWFVFNSFTWSDGKLNSSNLLLLSGQVVEHFDLQFRILYAQSMPISPKRPSSCRNSGIFDHLANRIESPKEYTVEGNLRAEFARLSSTPKKLLEELELAEDAPGGRPCNLGHSCLCEEEWFSDQEAIVERKSTSTQTSPWEEKPVVTVCNAATQTNVVMTETGTQTSVAARMTGTQTSVLLKTVVTQTKEEEYTETPLLHRKLSKEGSCLSGKTVSSSSLRSLSSSSSQCSLASSTGSLSSLRSFEYSSSHRAEYFQKLHKERQFHYSTIRSKLSHMVDILSRRGRVPENYMTQYTGRCNLK
ncbi:FA83D protein, partial [Pandion haliaetus]|nr:FA83D protein [Pandion haliaetus]